MSNLFGKLKDLNLATKLNLIFGALALVCTLAVIGGQVIYNRVKIGGPTYSAIERDMGTIDDIAKLRVNLSYVRAALLTLLIDRDPAVRQEQQQQIKDLSSRIDELFDTVKTGLEAAEKREVLANLAKAREAWNAFRETRDSRLIPLILENRLGEAMAIAKGVQAERYALFVAETKEAVELLRKDLPARTEAIRKEADLLQRMFIVGALLFALLMAAAAWFFKAVMVAPIQLVADRARRMAEGELSQVELADHRKDEIGEMVANFNVMTGKVGEIATIIKSGALSVSTSSQQLSTTAEDMNKGSQELASQIEQVVTAMTEVSQTIMDMAKNASQASDAAKSSADAAGAGRDVVDTTTQGMLAIAQTVRNAASTIEELGKNSVHIGEIITVISGIADQTNMLALNAAIEAARAGEQGRGFAVVADEVRKLAERTAKAAGDIAERVKVIQAEAENSVGAMKEGTGTVDKGMGLAGEASKSLSSIVDISRNAMDMVQRIAAATEQQSSATEEVSQTMENISRIAQRTAAATTQIRESAAELTRMASQLDAAAAWFKVSSSARTDRAA